MNSLKAESSRSSLVHEENNPAPGYANFTFYGIHTHKFIDWAKTTTKVPRRFFPKERQKPLCNAKLKDLYDFWFSGDITAINGESERPSEPPISR